MIEFIFYVLFPWIGAGILWVLNLGQKKYVDILDNNQELLAIIGGIFVAIFIVIFSEIFSLI